jgi:hypothetical protein
MQALERPKTTRGIEMNEEEIQEQPVGIDEALNQMKEDGHPPTGFHMMFFSEDFSLKEECPTNQLLQMVGSKYGFADTIKRQVYNMPKQVSIITYEFAWLGGFNLIKTTMEEVDALITNQFNHMVSNGTLSSYPKARISFLTNEGGEEE